MRFDPVEVYTVVFATTLIISLMLPFAWGMALIGFGSMINLSYWISYSSHQKELAACMQEYDEMEKKGVFK